MADGVTVQSDAGRVLRKFGRLPRELQTGVLQGLTRGLLLTEGAVARRTGVKSRRGAAGLLGRLTSYARRDLHHGVDAAIGFRRTRGFPYELSQEFGARAKPGKAMAIPVSRTARAASERGQGPREAFGDRLFLLRRGESGIMGGRTGLLMEGKGRSEVELHYVLVKRIAPRLRFRQSVVEMLPTISAEVVRGARGEMGAT